MKTNSIQERFSLHVWEWTLIHYRSPGSNKESLGWHSEKSWGKKGSGWNEFNELAISMQHYSVLQNVAYGNIVSYLQTDATCTMIAYERGHPAAKCMHMKYERHWHVSVNSLTFTWGRRREERKIIIENNEIMIKSMFTVRGSNTYKIYVYS